jgi:phage N-6-adenine-methyltransferase
MAGIAIPTAAAIEAGKLTVHLAAVELLAAALGMTLTLKSTTRSIYFRSDFHGWGTPPDLAAALANAVGGFDLDAASPGAADSAIPARHHFTEADNALAMEWHGQVFMNPPYGRTLAKWVAKALGEASAGRASFVIGLLPVRADTRWWHDHIVGVADIFALKGRLRFGNSEENAPFSSAVVVWWSGRPDEVVRRRIAEALVDAWHIPVAA